MLPTNGRIKDKIRERWTRKVILKGILI
jgi:hypothetical protein